MTSHLAEFHKISQHDNGGRVLLPDHPPEVIHSLIQGALSCNVLPGIPVALQPTKEEFGAVPALFSDNTICYKTEE